LNTSPESGSPWLQCSRTGRILGSLGVRSIE
jgi:hypothetical protein